MPPLSPNLSPSAVILVENYIFEFVNFLFCVIKVVLPSDILFLFLGSSGKQTLFSGGRIHQTIQSSTKYRQLNFTKLM